MHVFVSLLHFEMRTQHLNLNCSKSVQRIVTTAQIAEAETIKTSENNASMLAVLFSKKKFLNKC